MENTMNSTDNKSDEAPNPTVQGGTIRQDNTPDIQANRILDAIASEYEDDADDVISLITNTLCDLRHLCDKHQLDFAKLDWLAYQTYCAEKH